MAEFIEDGYQSALIGDRKRGNRAQYVDHAMMYAKGGISARVVDLPADTAMSRGIEVDGDTDDLIGDELKRLDLIGNMSDGLRWSRLDGGAALLVLTEDGSLSDPLPDVINKITEIRVIELNQLTVAPGGYYNDSRQSNYGQPELYQITPSGGSGPSNVNFFYCHESRILPVYGDPLPERLRSIQQVPWAGRPAVIEAYESIHRYQRGLSLSVEVLKRKQQAVHKMSGLMKMLQTPNGEQQVRKRVDLVDEVRSLMNGVAVDADDDYQIYDQNVSGIKELIDEFKMAISGDTGIPVPLLFSRTTSGLSASGESELEGFYDLCEGLQRTSAQPSIDRLVRLITRQRGTTWPGKWSLRWPSLWTPTDAQQAETRAKNAQADKAEADARQVDFDMGVVSEAELRDDAIRHGRYGLEAVSDG